MADGNMIQTYSAYEQGLAQGGQGERRLIIEHLPGGFIVSAHGGLVRWPPRQIAPNADALQALVRAWTNEATRPFVREKDCPSHDTRCTAETCIRDPKHPYHGRYFVV